MPFKLQGGPPAAKKPKVPLASELSFAVKPLPPPEIVKKMLLPEPERLIAVDVETHALIPDQPKGSWWQAGRFDIDTTVSDSDIASLRVVQVGWTYGLLGTAEPVTKVRLVRPDGFAIDEAATRKHHISQEHAIAQGVPLESVLANIRPALRLELCGMVNTSQWLFLSSAPQLLSRYSHDCSGSGPSR